MVVGISFNVAKSVPFPDAVAANPYWRQTMIHFSIGTFLNYQDFDANRRDQVRMTNEILPKLERLTPRGAAYLNEANYMQPDWQWVFYGPNYGKLNLIKAKYDPSDVFYALGAVGSDRWAQRSDGRLCRISG
ncbi:hypothetical protein GQ43DRAFT_374931 [Delitschia confertaspora ATCC 74209]|uniref:Berberine/berberine-like domain-containing protein n=1 Tax=Delitschia confertaspora ATCC 74209 TaxID=1513339 RepID=A0A9P4JKS1_9PLEO|nr:hypothetical protein GQ43DRAFT_374931 [Delitschia confertaspora ATCC 74209]